MVQAFGATAGLGPPGAKVSLPQEKPLAQLREDAGELGPVLAAPGCLLHDDVAHVDAASAGECLDLGGEVLCRGGDPGVPVGVCHGVTVAKTPRFEFRDTGVAGH